MASVFAILLLLVSVVPRLSLCMKEKSKGKGEPGKIYHVRNIGRENLSASGRTNELTHTLWIVPLQKLYG